MLTPTAITTHKQSARTTQQDLGKKDIFLKLLVAQMSNQDPLKPQDPTQIATQLAQFNMVDQQISTNKLLGELVKSDGNGQGSPGQLASTAGYLGHTVTINQSQIRFLGSPQSFIANLAAPATQASVSIIDASGASVRTMQLANLSQGANSVSWDGLTSSGETAPKGDYHIVISATDLQGKSVQSSIQRSGIVNAVRMTSSGTELMVDGLAAPLTKIAEIRL